MCPRLLHVKDPLAVEQTLPTGILPALGFSRLGSMTVAAGLPGQNCVNFPFSDWAIKCTNSSPPPPAPITWCYVKVVTDKFRVDAVLKQVTWTKSIMHNFCFKTVLQQWTGMYCVKTKKTHFLNCTIPAVFSVCCMISAGLRDRLDQPGARVSGQAVGGGAMRVSYMRSAGPGHQNPHRAPGAVYPWLCILPGEASLGAVGPRSVGVFTQIKPKAFVSFGTWKFPILTDGWCFLFDIFFNI